MLSAQVTSVTAFMQRKNLA